MKEQIERGARAMGIALPSGALDQFERFHQMIVEVNRHTNLTRVPDDSREAADRHVLDSLSPLMYGLLDGAKTLIDIGSGAGFPGIPLAIARPDLRVTLLDSQRKRVDFLNDAVRILGLNAEVVHARAEDLGKDAAYRDRFDISTARAVAALHLLIEWALPFTKVSGALIAYKGPTLEEEIAQARRAISTLGGEIGDSYAVKIPERDWDHRLLAVRKIAPTPDGFPRKPGEAAKKPIVD